MIDTNQFLERYRILSRDIQNNLQTTQKHLEKLQAKNSGNDCGAVLETIANTLEAWNDFAGWVLISTLENIEDAKKNCAPGRVDILSKITRAKLKMRTNSGAKGVSIDIKNVKSFAFDTYIQYFEQVIDLILSNAIKYSPKAGFIEISSSVTDNSCKISFSSMGPLVEKHEKNSLGLKGFRSECAKKLNMSGDGYGLYNALRIAQLLSATIVIKPTHRTVINFESIPYAPFDIDLIMPLDLIKSN
jgi:signal transduction histidine kinase